MNPSISRHLYSAAQTFLAVFLMGLAVNVKSLDLAALNQAVIAGIVLSAFRAAVKAGWEVVFPNA